MSLRFLSLALLAATVLAAGPALAQDVCAEYGRGKKQGRLDSKKIDEASGLVASLSQPGVYWTHNDSGDDDRVFAISDDGDYFGQWNLRGGDNEDWEDIAVGQCADGEWRCLYVADIGNNAGKRDEIVVYRVPEPTVDVDKKKPHDAKTDETVETLRLRYPGSGDAPDAEALFVGDDGAIYLFSKSDDGVELFRTWPLPADGERAVMESLGFRDDIAFVTGADLSPDSGRFVLRSVQIAYEFAIADGESIGDAFFSAPLEVRLRGEQQGEAIAYHVDGDALLTTSEGEEPPVYKYSCATWASELDDDGKADGVGGGGTAGGDAGCASGDVGVTWWGAVVIALLLAFRRRVRAAQTLPGQPGL